MNKVTFGAKLITPPEKFYLNTDTPVERIHINNMFKEIDGFLNMPEVDKFTSGDSVELIRKPSKNLFKYEILYKSNTPLADAINDGIRMNFGKHKNFGSFNTIFQIANVVYHKRGKQPRIGADFLSHISEAFDLTSDQMGKSIVKMLKNIL